MATVKKAAKKVAKKAAPKKAAPKKAAKQSTPKPEKKKPVAEESQPDFLARRAKENSEHTQAVREDLGLPPSYAFNPSEIDTERSAEIERHKAGLANREKLNKEAEGQTVS